MEQSGHQRMRSSSIHPRLLRSPAGSTCNYSLSWQRQRKSKQEGTVGGWGGDGDGVSVAVWMKTVAIMVMVVRRQ